MFRFVLSLFLSIQLAIAPTYAIAKKKGAENPNPISLGELQSFESLYRPEGKEKVDAGRMMMEAHALAEKFAEKKVNPSEFTKNAMPAFGITGQVERHFSNGKVIAEVNIDGNPESTLRPIAVDAETGIQRGRVVEIDTETKQVVVRGYSGGHKVAERTVPTIKNPVAVTLPENRMSLVLTREGKVKVFDQGLIDKTLFRGFSAGLPYFDLWDAKKHFKVNENFRIEFISRGMNPGGFAGADEVRNSLKEGAAVSRNRRGQALIEAGDAVIYELKNGQKVVHAVLPRDGIQTQIRIGTIYLSAFVLHLRGDGIFRSMGEKMNAWLKIEGAGNRISPGEKFFQLAEKENATLEANKWLEKSLKKYSMDPLMLQLMRSYKRKDLVSLVDSVEESGKDAKREREKITAEQHVHSFANMLDKALQERELLRQEIANAKTDAERLMRESKLTQLERQIENMHFNENSIDLAKAKVTNTRVFKFEQDRWYKAYFSKPFLIGLTAVATFSAAAYGFLSHAPAIINKEMHASKAAYAAVTWTYNMIPAQFREPALFLTNLKYLAAGFSIVPGVQLIAAISTNKYSPLYWAAAKMKKRGGSLGVWGDKIVSNLDTWGQKTVYTRVFTMGLRIYGSLLPMIQMMSQLTLQNFGNSTEAGLPPWKRVQVDTAKGKQKVMVGLNLPRISKDARREHRAKQDAAINKIVDQKERARMTALAVAAIVASHGSNIPPEMLILANRAGFDVQQLKKFAEDPRALKTLQTLRGSLYYLIARNAQSGQIDLQDISKEEMRKIVEAAFELRNRIEKNSKTITGKAKNTLLRLWNLSKGFGSGSLKAVGNLGKEQSQMLKTAFLNPFLTRRATQEWVNDRAAVIVLPMLTGPHAQAANPGMWAAQEGTFLWMHPMMKYSVIMNDWAHGVAAAARRALVFQMPTMKSNRHYDTLSATLLNATNNPEVLRSSMISWMKGFHPSNNNMGSYLIRDLTTSIQTIHTSLAIAVGARMMFVGVDFAYAMLQGLTYFFGAKLAYGWPWTPLTLIAGYVEDKTGETRAKINRLAHEVYQADLEKNKEAADQKAKEILELFRKTTFKGTPIGWYALVNQIKQIEKSQGISMWNAKDRFLTKDLKKRLKNAFTAKEAERMLLIMNEVFETYKKPESEQRTAEILELQQRMLNLLSAKRHDPKFKEVMSDVFKRSKALADVSLQMPPGFTHQNEAMEQTMTWTFGVTLTTILATIFTVFTFTGVTAKSAAIIIGGSIALHPVLQFMFSKETWDKLENWKVKHKRRARARDRARDMYKNRKKIELSEGKSAISTRSCLRAGR